MTKNIIIDAGHGGSDNGGGGRTTCFWGLEKEINLKIALYMEQRLKELKFNTAMTRTNDTSLPLADRMKKVNSFFKGQKAICLAIHHNAGKGKGAEILVSKDNNKELARITRMEFKRIGHLCYRKWGSSLSEPGIIVRLLTNDWYHWKKGDDYYYSKRTVRDDIEHITIEFEFWDNPDQQQVKVHSLLWKERAEAVIKALCKYVDVEYFAPGKEKKMIFEFDQDYDLVKFINAKKGMKVYLERGE